MKELPEINIITTSCKTEIKEKGSRFLGFTFPVENEEEVLSNLNKLKKEFYDASHHCYAYKLVNLLKYSDAGEPNGTAGIRILNAIEHYDLTNLLVVVVRYFGGTKLGVGGLGRAYYEAASEVLEKTDKQKKFLYRKILIKIDYQLVQKVYHIFNNSENHIINVNYSDSAYFECYVKPNLVIGFMSEINDISNGKAEIEMKNIIYY